MNLLLATTNKDKVREIRGILSGLEVTLLTLDDVPAIAPPEETGLTFEENARLKALYYAAASGDLVVAEDSGLEIDALGGRPGVESARFGGEGTLYPEKFALLYAQGAAGSAARFVCALALAGSEGVRLRGARCRRRTNRAVACGRWRVRLRPDLLLPAVRHDPGRSGRPEIRGQSQGSGVSAAEEVSSIGDGGYGENGLTTG